jgi:hypothetical protein
LMRAWSGVSGFLGASSLMSMLVFTKSANAGQTACLPFRVGRCCWQSAEALAERHQPKRPSGMGLALMGFANRKARHGPMPLYGALQATCKKGLHVRIPYM